MEAIFFIIGGLIVIYFWRIIIGISILIALIAGGGIIGWSVGNGVGGYAIGVIGLVVGGLIGMSLILPFFDMVDKISRSMEDATKKKRQQEFAKEAERKQKEERLEAERKQKQDETKYDQIINCPICEGNGKAYIKTTSFGYYDDDGGYCSRDLPDKLASKMLFDMHPNEWWEEDDWSYIYRDKECPFCRGDGIAYAWYEKMPASKHQCEECQGSGQITTKIKLEIGIGDKKITCAKCNGIGSFQVPEKSIVHVKTKSGGIYNDNREECKCDEGGSIGDYPKRFIMEITKENKELLEKSKPRTFQ
ncbi:MAG: hypothetical protein Q7U57_18330 [Methylovulum sp.]|nr:hypothetical protein [Methylovulum sp.]